MGSNDHLNGSGKPHNVVDLGEARKRGVGRQGASAGKARAAKGGAGSEQPASPIKQKIWVWIQFIGLLALTYFLLRTCQH